ncbi:hypothetical protein E4U35_002080 [Claviceps purpurea]|nr:hypothetical protein E4U35_002080 [Claviceps purpurea]KAG6238623.1 hypothetical protein E4U24_007082 [Claviceps purpurea]KAG6276810.1 hypothetical protein E4U48_001459 [Claviceps purpurea]KAG6307584.1 hypothetical protein E4U45_004170 [Claviceps purpurea]
MDGLTPFSYQNFQASKTPPTDAARAYSLCRETHNLLSHRHQHQHPVTPAPTPAATQLRGRPCAADDANARLARPAPLLLSTRGRLLPPPLPRRVLSRRLRATSPAAYRALAIMSVAYEPRSFMHEGAYPSLGEEHDEDHGVDQRYTDSEVAAHLSHYTADAALLEDDRIGDDRIGDERGIMVGDDECTVQDSAPLDLDAKFPSPIPDALHAPLLPTDPISACKEPSPATGSPASMRIKTIAKPDRDVVKQADGKFHCPLEDCKEDVRTFSRKCEWNKHMDKHERPYRCPAAGCENLPGFTYSGGLLRHEREVHGKHGGPKNTVNCPHPNCKRHTGKGFSRQENLNEHLRRVHTNSEGGGITPPPPPPPPPQLPVAAAAAAVVTAADWVTTPEDNESEKSGTKRKRRWSGQSDEIAELRGEIKRAREANEKLRAELEQQSQHSLAMMAQIAELQDALRDGLGQNSLGAPTAQMM